MDQTTTTPIAPRPIAPGPIAPGPIAPGSPADDIGAYLDTARPRPWWQRKLVWIPALLVLLGVGAWAIFAPGERPPDYITQEVQRRSLDLTVAATGNLRPTNLVQVGSEVSGRIDRVYVDVNDQVQRGQVIARINTDVIEDQITQGRANLDAARAAVAQARATLEVDQAQLARLVEVQRLSDGRVPSQTELEAAEANVRRDRAQVASAQANVTSAQAQLSSALTNRDRAVIRSPISGVVLARQVEPGQTVAASFSTPTLFVLAEDLSVMQLRIDIDEADVAQVEPGQRATFTVDAYPGRRFPAQVTRIDLASGNIASESQQEATGAAAAGNSVVNYEARLAVNNTERLLRPGMTATATIATASTGTRLLVPNAALRFDPEAEEAASNPLNPQVGLGQDEQQATIGIGSRQTVHVVQEDGTLEAIEVVTGESNGRWTVVTSDALRPGMDVVTGIRVAGE